MFWLLMISGHASWYWILQDNKSLSSTRKEFNFMRILNNEKIFHDRLILIWQCKREPQRFGNIHWNESNRYSVFFLSKCQNFTYIIYIRLSFPFWFFKLTDTISNDSCSSISCISISILAHWRTFQHATSTDIWLYGNFSVIFQNCY